jgi:hypothetical protein
VSIKAEAACSFDADRGVPNSLVRMEGMSAHHMNLKAGIIAAAAVISVAITASAADASIKHATSVLPLAGTTLPDGQPVMPDANTYGCSANMQNPHYSSGAGGVIAKSRWKCDKVPVTIRFNPHFVYGYSF